MIEKCVDWLTKSNVLADVYYRAMTNWVTSRRATGSVRDLLKLAKSYEKALNGVLNCLQKYKGSPPVEKQIVAINQDLSLVRSDLSMLSNIKD